MSTLEEIEAAERMLQSDTMICTNVESLHFKHKAETDRLFMHPLNRPIPCCIRDIGKESKMFTDTFGTRTSKCTPGVMTRGNNHPKTAKPYDSTLVGYDYFDSPLCGDLMMIPCKQNTFRNHLVADHLKTCSASHQLFNNLTKRV